MIRITAVYTGLQGLPGVSTFHFQGDSEVSAQNCHDIITAMYVELAEELCPPLVVTIDGLPTRVNEATNETTAFYDVPETSVVFGGPGEEVPTATQINLRVRTSGIVRGRRVLGHIYLPGMTSTFLSNGQLTAPSAAAFSAVVSPILLSGDPGERFGVYSRPIDGVGGTFHEATSVDCSQKLAVLTSRRD